MRKLADELLYNEIVFAEGLRVVFAEDGTEKEMSFQEFSNETGGEFNQTDFHLMKCSLVLNGAYKQSGSRAFAIRAVPGTLSYQLQPRT